MIEFMNTGMAAQELGVSEALIRKWEMKGVIPPTRRLAGSRYRIFSTDDVVKLRQLIAERRAGKTRADAPTA